MQTSWWCRRVTHLMGFVCIVSFLCGVALSEPNSDPNTNITYVTGTCKKTTPALNLSNFYNQEAMLVKDFTGKNIGGSEWDLGKDGAFVGYHVLMCAPSPSSYGAWPPDGFRNLIRQKGFTLFETCDLATHLSYPKYHVFILYDRSGVYPTTPTPLISLADAQAAADFYVKGGGIYALTDNCPHIANVNRMFQAFPPVLAKFQMRYNNNINYPFNLRHGNPVADNQFGHHPAFTGIPEMSSGHSLSIPYYDGKFGIGVFAVMCTVVINQVPIACASEPAPSFVYSHASVMYVDPLVQLWNISGACNWGRIVADTAWTRYGREPTRTGSWRLASNVVVWLLNIEKIFDRNLTSGGKPYSPINCNATNTTTDDADQTQVLGCSNGDALTLKSPTLMCRVGFAGSDAPACLALVVTETSGTTCVVDLQNAKIGTYWILVDGKNTSLQFSVTAASLTPRGTVIAVTGTCIKTSPTSLAGCTDGSSVTIDWTLPYPKDLTLGIGSTATVCRSFAVSGTFVTCVFRGLNTMARGRYQTYINGVATGIPLTVQTDIAGLNKVLCSGSHSLSPQASSQVSNTETALVTATRLLTRTSSATDAETLTVTVSASASATGTATFTASQQGSGTLTETAFESVSLSRTSSRSQSVKTSDTHHVELTATHIKTPTHTNTTLETATTSIGTTESVPESATARVPSKSKSLELTSSRTWMCVNATRLAAVLAPYVAAALRVTVVDADVVNGTSVSVILAPIAGLDAADLRVPWFEPWEVLAYLVPVDTPNINGFAERTGSTAGIRILFPNGLGSVASRSGLETPGSVPAIVVIPPISDYKIFATETVLLQVQLADTTLGRLCAVGEGARARPPSVSLDFVRLVVEVSQDISDIQAFAAPVLAVMSAVMPLAAPDLQAVVMIVLMPCTNRNSYQRRNFAMFRALSPFTLDDTYEGVLWGNLIANVLGIGLHAVAVVATSVVTKVSVSDASVAARFPGLYLSLLWYLTFGSTCFAALQVLSGDSGADSLPVGDSTRALGALMLCGVCVAVPGAIAFYILRRAEAYFRVYEYHKWRRSDTALRVRLLSTVLLPVGRWEPMHIRRRLGSIVTNQCRPEFYWMLLPLASPVLISLFSLVRNESERICVWIYLLLALLHVALMILIVVCKPLRTMLEDWLQFAAFALTMLQLVGLALTLVFPPHPALLIALDVLPTLQFVLLLLRTMYHICHFFIARRIATVVPSRVLFEWSHGEASVDESGTAGGSGFGSNDQASLFEELNELLLRPDDDVDMLLSGKGADEVELHEDFLRPIQAAEVAPLASHDEEVDDFLSMLNKH